MRNTNDTPAHGVRWSRVAFLLCLGAVVGVIGFFLITSHAGHTMASLPWLLLAGLMLLCLLMHRGHGGHSHGDGGGRKEDDHAR